MRVGPNDVLLALRDCLHQALDEADVLPALVAVTPGSSIPEEYLIPKARQKCGVAFIRSTQMYPALQVGVVDQTSSNCGASLGVDIEVGIMRCYSVPDVGKLKKPDDAYADYLSKTVEVNNDAVLMRQAIACCEILGQVNDYTLGTYSPYGPEGNVVGGIWELFVLL